MKTSLKVSFLYSLFALCGCLLSGCGDNSPSSKFSGIWEQQNNVNVNRMTYDFDNNSILRVRADKNGKLIDIEQTFFTIETKEDRVAMATTSEQTIVPELRQDGTLLVKVYAGKHSLDSLYPKNSVSPKSTLLFSRPQKANDALFSKAAPAYKSWNGDWTTATSESPALRFDAEGKKLMLLDEESREILKTDAALVTKYVEWRNSNNGDQARIYIESAESKRKNYSAYMFVDLSLSPPEAALIVYNESKGGIAFRSDALVSQLNAKDKAQWIADKKRKSEEEAAEKKRALEEEAEKDRQILEAKQEAKAKMPPFSFGKFTLADTPQQVIEKALGKYKIATSFPVQQEGKEIAILDYKQNFGSIKVTSASLDEFFTHHRRKNQFTDEYNLSVSKEVIEAGLKIDSISLEEKDGSQTGVIYYYYTLPGGEPKALYMGIAGPVVQDVPFVYQERYGNPEFISTSCIWFSNIEAAITRIDGQYRVLYLVSKKNYDEYAAFADGVTAKIEADEAAKRKAEQDARKGKI